MRSRRADAAPESASIMLADDPAVSWQARPWFVYLFASSDCSTFKVGFSCNPLQRIHSFSHRYFERFDLDQSLLLHLRECEDARAVEATLKADLAQFRISCPSWVPHQAGGHTEWFGAPYFGQAEATLQSCVRSHAGARLTNTYDFVRGELDRLSAVFEPWAWEQARQIDQLLSSGGGGQIPLEVIRSLRDWLDAYRYFDLSLFKDDVQVRTFVGNAARLAG
jgi:hypothetical protein